MNVQFYLEKLYASQEFEKFKQEFPDAYLCSGFFVVDLVGNDNKQHFDFYSKSMNKLFSFQFENSLQKIPLENIEEEKLNKLLMNYELDFEDIQKIIEEEMRNKEIKNNIHKLLFSLQNINGKDFLVGTIFISNMGMLKVKIEPSEKKIIELEKKSFMDFIKIQKD